MGRDAQITAGWCVLMRPHNSEYQRTIYVHQMKTPAF
jgi:hypothetical protein